MRLQEALELRHRLQARTGNRYEVWRSPRASADVSPFYVKRVSRAPVPKRPRRRLPEDAVAQRGHAELDAGFSAQVADQEEDQHDQQDDDEDGVEAHEDSSYPLA